MNVKDITTFLRSKNVTFTTKGSEEQELTGYSSVFKYKPNTITWLRDVATLSAEGFIIPDSYSLIITKNEAEQILQAACQIWVDNPKDTFFDIIDNFWGEKETISISPKSVIEEGAIIGANVAIGPYTHISAKTIVGDNCKIGSNVTIKGKVTIGNDCVIQSGAVLGEDGFGFIKHEGYQKFVKHYGGVTLENHVQIGSHTCVCRGAIDDTYISEYTKIDNLCHIAHNVEIGKRCLVIAGTVVMGSVRIGDDCWIATSMIRDLRHVCNDCTVGMGAVVVKDVPSGVTVVGNPAKTYFNN